MRAYTGDVAGIRIMDGEAVGPVYPDGISDDAKATILERFDVQRAVDAVRSYARRHGLVFDGGRLLVPDADDQAGVDSRDVSTVKVGTPLRDAAVDPRRGDYLPPTNAGKADPHGPLVVSPELHGSEGVRPVLPGSVDAAPAQEVAETADAADQTDVDLAEPKHNAGKPEWVAYAISKGADPDEAGRTSRADLIEAYGSPAE